MKTSNWRNVRDKNDRRKCRKIGREKNLTAISSNLSLYEVFPSQLPYVSFSFEWTLPMPCHVIGRTTSHFACITAFGNL